MATQIIRDQIVDDAINSAKIDLSDNFTFSGSVSGSSPSADANFATKQYVDQSVVSGNFWKEAVKAATTTALAAYSYSNGTITMSATGAFPQIDGVSLQQYDRILLKDETGAKAPYNGIYELTVVGNGSTAAQLSRSPDMTASSDFKGATVAVLDGTVNDNRLYHCDNDTDPNVGTDNISFIQISNQQVSGGDGIVVTGNSIAVDRATVSGLTFASNKLAVNTSDGIEIVSDALKAKVKSGGALIVDVNGLDVGSNAIQTSHIAAAAIGTSQLANNSVDASKIASNAVNSDELASNSVISSKIASSSITAAKLAFSSYQDLATGDGSQTAFDLSQEVPTQFQKMILVHRNGLLLNEDASPANVDEYSVSLTGGAGGVTRITFGSAPSASDKLTIRFLA
jgi:hypothetical protein